MCSGYSIWSGSSSRRFLSSLSILIMSLPSGLRVNFEAAPAETVAVAAVGATFADAHLSPGTGHQIDDVVGAELVAVPLQLEHCVPVHPHRTPANVNDPRFIA